MKKISPNKNTAVWDLSLKTFASKKNQKLRAKIPNKDVGESKIKRNLAK